MTLSRRGVQTLLKWLLSATLLALVLWHVPFPEIGNGLARTNPGWLVAGFALYFLMRVPPAWRMRLITQHQRMALSTVEIYKIGLVTSFFGLFFPGYIAGGAIRWHMLSRKDKGVEALASVVFDRVNDTAVLMSIGCVCILIEPKEAMPVGAFWILAVSLASLLIMYAMLLNPRMTRLAVRLAEGSGLLRWEWLRRSIARLVDSMHRFRQFSLGERAQLLGLSVLGHALGTLMYFSLAASLDLGLGFTTCGWLRAVLHLLFLMPLTVGGIGVRETALIVLLVPLGATAAQAVTYSFLLTLGLLLVAGVGGLLAPGTYIAPRKASG